MPKTRRRSFDRAHSLLEDLRKNRAAINDAERASPDQLRPLRLLQSLLIKEIARAERKIRRSKAILKSLDAVAAPDLAEKLEERIEFYRHLAYSWRCFGDAIAFMFLDKFALKHTYFNTHNLNPKQDAGFLVDKAGLVGELKILDRLINSGVPVILTDLTNTIRHGDVCLLIGSDPLLIEVKSGKLDQRGKRQRKSIRQLMDFFDTDEAEGLRGLEKLRRVSSQTSEVTYVSVINDCIAAAIKNGIAWRSPEQGLYYVVLADDEFGLEEVINEFQLTQPLAFLLNDTKASRTWAPYSPFTLSIRDKGALFRFIWGEIYIVVLYDAHALCPLAEECGFVVAFEPPESDFAFEISRLNGASQLKLAKQMFFRLAFDFTSPAWLLRTAIESLERNDLTSAALTEQGSRWPLRACPV